MWPFDDILSALNSIYTFFINLVDMLLYIPERFVQFLHFLIGLAWEIPDMILSMINRLIGVFTDIVQTVLSFIPFNVMGLYLLAFIIIVFIRIYQVISDIQVLGFKL